MTLRLLSSQFNGFQGHCIGETGFDSQLLLCVEKTTFAINGDLYRH